MFSNSFHVSLAQLPELIQAVLGKESGHLVGDLQVVQVLKGEVRIAADADVREKHQPRLAAVTINGLHPKPRHGEADSPVVEPSDLRGLGRNVVAVVENDWNPSQRQELC